jgi:hypothetical protein
MIGFRKRRDPGDKIMQGEPTNTPENILGPGITEQQILEAVRKSGYPLQTVIASSLRLDFQVQEEWSFLDSDTGALRTLDIWASRRMFDLHNENQPFVRPTLDLLIECKQSDLPYVFFVSATRPWLREFPYFAGLAHDRIVVTTDDDPSTYTETILSALSLAEHPFIRNAAEPCMTFSKCVRKGDKIELSGTEAFQSTVLPLLKALRYFKKQERPPSTARYFDCHIPLAIAVIDAPMIAARIQNDTSSLTLTPWVRVVRYEAVHPAPLHDRIQTFGIDVVHKSFFERYLQQHAIPFAQEFTPLALKHHLELSTGKGFVPGMNADWMSIESRLRPTE